jgi:hypothetical protein
MAAHKGFSSASSVLGRALKHPIRTALLIFFFVITILWTHEWVHRKYEALDTVWLGGGRTGLIMIDTPQLYTRERLVNDRFREAAWLEQRLENTDDLLKERRFGQADLLQARLLELKMAVGGDAASETGSSPAPDSDRLTDPDDLHPTPHDELEDVLRYRETLRAQLMDTQLDDRHDIAGNTIYRLNFHAVIVPERGAQRPAAISVTLTETDSRSGEAVPYVDLWYDWRDELQRQVSGLVEDKTLSIIKGARLTPSEHSALIKFIDDALEEKGITDFGFEVYAPVIEDRKKEFLKHVFSLERDGIWTSSVDDILLKYGSSCSRTREIERQGLEHQPESQSTQSPVQSWHETVLDPVDVEGIIGKDTRRYSTGNVKCLVFNAVAELDVKMDAATILDVLPEDSTAEGCNTHVNMVVYVLTDRADAECRDLEAIRSQWKYLDEHEKRQALISRFMAKNLLKTRTAGTRSAEAVEQLELGFFFDFDVEHCGLELCYPVVRAPEKVEANGWCPDSEESASDQHRAERGKTPAGRVEWLAECLKKALSSVPVATYSVMPGKEVQRLQLLDKQALVMEAEDREGGLLLWRGHEIAETAGLEREPVILGIGDWGSRTDGASSDASATQPGDPTGAGSKKTQTGMSGGAEGSKTKPPETKFAWVVLPRGEVSGAHRAEQRPDHVTMNAVVSVPSWWKNVHLNVVTCWLDSTNLVEKFDPDKLCNGSNVDRQFEVALPGNASEVMTKLRFEVLTFPYLLGPQRQPQNVLEVGREGSLIILGGRLWRSPKVLMGNQIADRIEVLPDMKGIVAHFNCVRPYPGTPGAPKLDEILSKGSGADKADSSQTNLAASGSESPASSNETPHSDSAETQKSASDSEPPPSRNETAVVWTSEGRTGNLGIELRPYSKRVGELTDDPCWLHEDEDNG